MFRNKKKHMDFFCPSLPLSFQLLAVALGLGTCRTQCGDVSVPFPFGLSPGCHLSGFDLTCDTSHTPPRLLLDNGTSR